MNTVSVLSALERGELDSRLSALYGEGALAEQRARYASAVAAFQKEYGDKGDVRLFSVTGRSELSGNHTDHNRGSVIAASVSLDIIAVAAAREGGRVRVLSEGFGADEVNIDEYTEPCEALFSTSKSLVAGMCTGLRERGYRVGGADIYTTSNVLKGSGLSSSAAFEVMMGAVQNELYNNGAATNVELAQVAQYAENRFFGKPCGLMDQVACAVGGIVAIDFADEKAPLIEKIDFDMTAHGIRLCIVNTGGNHADLTPDYAAVPAEMKAVAAALGKTVLREVGEEEFLSAIPALRERVGDRAILRALHFYGENKRVARQREALRRGDLAAFFSEVLASGRSSFQYLQNAYSAKNPAEQGISLALSLADRFVNERGVKGAYRVHGGGFAGTVQAFLPCEEVEDFRTLMDGVFGKGACMVLEIRPEGVALVL